MRPDRHSRSSGHALITVLGLLAVFFPIGVFALREAYVDLLLGRQTQIATELFYVAEAGLTHALADLATDPIFERLATGPDGIAGTADDEAFPFQSPPPTVFPRAPFRYEVAIAERTATRLQLYARAVGPNGAGHRVAAAIAREPAAFAPAPVAIRAAPVTFSLGSAFEISGFDAAGTESPRPAITVSESTLASELVQQLGPSGNQLVGAGGAPSLNVEPIGRPVEHALSATDLPGAQLIGPVAGGQLGPGYLVRNGSLDVADAQGSGLLIVKGHLRVTTHFAFAGLIVVEGDVEFAPESTVGVRGAIWQGPAGQRWALLGAGTIAYDSGVMDGLAAALPTLFLHRARVTGWRDLF
jgi:hypothetical protein